jgi:PKD repeat protein
LYDPQVNGLTVTVNGNVAPGYSGASISRVHWDWGDGSGGDYSFPASHTYSKPGTYNVTVTVYQSDGLTTSKTITVTLQALNRPPVADFSYSPPSPLAGEAVSFTDKSYDPDGSIVYWHWDFGDGAASSERNPSHVYTSPGTYTVTLKVRDDKGAESSRSRIIQVKAQQAVSTPTETSTPAAIVLVVAVAIVALYLILKRLAPKPPPPPLLPPPPPPG